MNDLVKSFYIRFHVLENGKMKDDIVSGEITHDNMEVAAHTVFGDLGVEWKAYSDVPDPASDIFGPKKSWFKFDDPGTKKTVSLANKNKLIITLRKTNESSFSFRFDLLAELENGDDVYLLKSNSITFVKANREININV